jgi:hypothetical protein
MAKYFIDAEFHEYSRQAKLFGFPYGRKRDTIELISIGITRDDGKAYYAICNEFDVNAAWDNDWLRENVLEDIHKDLYYKQVTKTISNKFTKDRFTILLERFGKSKEQIADEIAEFTGCEYENDQLVCKDPNIEFYGYYADYDWVVFCWLFGRMIDLPKGYPMYCKDLKQYLDDYVSKLKMKYINTNKSMSFEDKLAWVKQQSFYPKNKGEHNALADARFNKRLWRHLKSLKAI